MKNFVFILSLIFTLNLFADSSVWKVSNGSNYVYIGGTMHILSKDDYPLPKPFQKAYLDSQVLVFEADLSKMKTPEAQKKFMLKANYDYKDSLRNYISKDTFNSLKNYTQKRNIPLDVFLQFKPGVLSIFITIQILKEQNITTQGVDSYFENKAKKDKKQIFYLEKVDDQIGFIINMGKGNEDKVVSYTLEEVNTLPKKMDALRNAWKNGDLKALEEVELNEFKKEFPIIYHNLLTKRNDNWLPKIKQMFKTKEIEYVLFGALHLAGKDGILYKLKKQGYKIEQVK